MGGLRNGFHILLLVEAWEGCGAVPIGCRQASARVNLIPDGRLIQIQAMQLACW